MNVYLVTWIVDRGGGAVRYGSNIMYATSEYEARGMAQDKLSKEFPAMPIIMTAMQVMPDVVMRMAATYGLIGYTGDTQKLQ